MGGGASRVAFQEIPLLRRGSSGRRRVSRRFSRNSSPSEGWLWEATRLASLFKKFSSLGGTALGGGASRVASQEIPLLRRGGSGRRRVSRRFSRNSSPSEGCPVGAGWFETPSHSNHPVSPSVCRSSWEKGLLECAAALFKNFLVFFELLVTLRRSILWGRGLSVSETKIFD